MNALTKAAQDVLAERQRQIRAEGWTPEHDDEHAGGQMADAAAAYALEASHQVGGMMPSAPNDVPPSIWPWDEKWWKPKGARTNLVRAAALLLAEIERLDRAAGVDLPAARPPTAVEDAFLHRAVRESSKLVAPGKLAAGVQVLPEPFATLHDDGHWTMPPGKESYKSRFAGWWAEVYSAEQLRAALGVLVLDPCKDCTGCPHCGGSACAICESPALCAEHGCADAEMKLRRTRGMKEAGNG